MRKNILMIIFAILIMSLASIVYAETCTINAPATSGSVVAGNFSINFTVTGMNATANLSGFGFNFTARNGVIYPGRYNTVAVSENTTVINLSFAGDNTNTASDQQVTITAIAYQNSSICSTTTQLVIDNANIDGTYDSVTPSNNARVTSSGGGNFSVTSNSNEEIYRAYLLIGSQDQILMTNSSVNGTTVSYSPTRFQAPEGSYPVSIRLEDTDGSTTTLLATRFIVFDYTGSKGGSKSISLGVRDNKKVLLGLGFILVFAYFYRRK